MTPGGRCSRTCVEPATRADGQRVDGDLAAHTGEIRNDRLGVVPEVGLRQEDDRARAALEHERHVALEDAEDRGRRRGGT